VLRGSSGVPDLVHGVMPAVLLLDWLLQPPATRPSQARASR